MGPIDYLSQHSLAPHERVSRAGEPSEAFSVDPSQAFGTESTSAANIKQRVDQLKARLAERASLVPAGEDRATFMDLVRFIDTGAEALEAIDILADLAGPTRAGDLRELRTLADRLFPPATR